MRSKARPIIRIVDIGFGYAHAKSDDFVLKDVSFDISPGEFVAVVGPSGVGKSTLLRVIAGLVRADQGEVIVEAFARQGALNFGFVFQDPRLLPWRTVARNVEFALEGLRLTKTERRARALDALALVGLSDKADRWPRQLSGGQRQRVGLARALAVRPSVLLMDEPFAALDPTTRHNLQDELLAIKSKAETSIIFVTHDMAEATYLADRILVLGGAPAKIVREFAIDLPHPRLREAPEGGVGSHEVKSELFDMFDRMEADRRAK